MATVTKIPATVSRYTAVPIAAKAKAQLDYYITYIKGNDEWEFAGVYSDL